MKHIKTETKLKGLNVIIALVVAVVFVIGMMPLHLAAKAALNEASGFSISKTARVNGGDEKTGSAADPIIVHKGDNIEYILSLTAPVPSEIPVRYDVVFVLDWSNSMNQSYDLIPGSNARIMAKDTILAISEYIFTEYPDSRISVMGLNAYENNTMDMDKLYLEVDTPFVGKDEYISIIQNAYPSYPGYMTKYAEDTNMLFLRAAVDKLAGNETTYGGFKFGSTNVPLRTVNIRSENDMQRIPLIIQISDFQMTSYDTTKDQNWALMNQEITRLRTLLPEAVFLAVRTDHYANDNYNKAIDDYYMNKFILIGGTRNGSANTKWGWIKFTGTQTMDADLEGLLQTKAPPKARTDAIITDTLPAGIVPRGRNLTEMGERCTPGAAVSAIGAGDDLRYVLTWNYEYIPEGGSVFRVETIVTSVGASDLLINKATADIEVEKQWRNFNGTTASADGKPAATVRLYRKPAGSSGDGELVTAANNPAVLNNSSNWKTTWTGLPVGDSSGIRYIYYVVEDEVNGYDTSFQVNGGAITIDQSENAADPPGKVVIFNQESNNNGTIRVIKEWKDFYGNTIKGSGTMPDVTVHLIKRIGRLSGGLNPEDNFDQIRWESPQEAGMIILNGNNDWRHTWLNLPKGRHDDNTNTTLYYFYYILEDVSDGYSVSYSDNNILNITDISAGILNGTITIINQNLGMVKMPESGGPGITWPLIAGITVMVLAMLGVWLYIKSGGVRRPA